MAKYCPNCGKEVVENEVYCGSCGVALNECENTSVNNNNNVTNNSGKVQK